MADRYQLNEGQRLKAYRSYFSEVDARGLLLFIAGYFLSVTISEHAYGSLAVPSPFWLPSSVFLCALLLTPKKYWWIFFLVALQIRIIVGAVPGTPYWFLLSAIVNDLLKAFFAAWWLHRVLRRPGHLSTLNDFMIFLGIAAVAAPLLSALAAMPARHALGDSLWSGGYRWFLGDSVAQVVVTPTLLLWCTRSYRHANSRLKELFLLCGALIVVMSYSFLIPPSTYSPIFFYAPVPLLIWAAFRLRPFGTANSLALVASFAILSAAEGVGVFSGSSPNENVLSLQLFLLLVSVPLLSLAILNAERESKVEELTTLLGAAPIAILVAEDPECMRVTANRTGYQLYGLPIGANLSRSVPPTAPLSSRITRDGVDIPTKDLPLQRAASGMFVHGESYTLRAEDGTERYIVGNAAPLFGEDGKPRGAVGAFLDFTAQRVIEDMLRESEERFRLVANTAPVLLWMADIDKLRTFFNKGWLDFTGRTIEQEFGNGWLSGVHPDDLERFHEIYSAAFDDRREYKIEYRLRRFDGEYRWILAHGVPRFEPNGSFCGYIGSCIDIADRKLAEECLRELSGRLIRAQEHERARIARELHDDLGQRMALIQMEIERVERETAGLSLHARQQLQAVAQEASQMSSDIHELSHQLHPSKLALGLVIALKGYCRDISAQNQLNVHFVHDGVPKKIPKEVSLCLYRIVQEALWNVVKYSGASEATVELLGQDGQVSVCISDLGVGFDTELMWAKGGLGLISMRERIWQVGGSFSVQSEPSQGTRICASARIHATDARPGGKVQNVGA